MGSGFSVENTGVEYDTLPELISKSKQALNLTNDSKPCPGNKFSYLYNSETRNEVLGYSLSYEPEEKLMEIFEEKK